jgi:hypothetical protein
MTTRFFLTTNRELILKLPSYYDEIYINISKYVIYLMPTKFSSFHLAVCLTTGPKPLPKRALHIVRSRASSFKWKYPILSLSSSNSFLRLLPCLPVTSIPPCIFPSKFSYQPINSTCLYSTRSKHTAFYDENKQQAQLRSCQNGFTRPYPITGWQLLPLNSIYVHYFRFSTIFVNVYFGTPKTEIKIWTTITKVTIVI